MLRMGDTYSNVFWHTFINITVCFQKKRTETRMINLTIYIKDDYRADCCERPKNAQNVFIIQTSDDKTDRQNTYSMKTRYVLHAENIDWVRCRYVIDCTFTYSTGIHSFKLGWPSHWQ